MDRARDPDFAQRLFGGRPEHRLALMRAAWPAAVGPDIARRAEVVAIDRNVLRIKVPDPRWQRTLLRMRGDILARLRTVAGDAAPRALGFVVGPVAEAAEPSSPPSPATGGSDAPRAGVTGADHGGRRDPRPGGPCPLPRRGGTVPRAFRRGQGSGRGSGSASG